MSSTSTPTHTPQTSLDRKSGHGSNLLPIMANSTKPMNMKIAWRYRKNHELPFSCRDSTEDAE